MRQENIGGMENWKVRCAERKHRGWQDSNGEAETERKEREIESEGERWNMGCCQPSLKGYWDGEDWELEKETPPETGGFQAGGSVERKRHRDVDGGGWDRSGDADGLRRAESKGVPLVGLPRPGSATLPGARARLTSRSSGSSPGRSPRCPLPALPLPSRPLQHLSLPATALGQRLARARPRAASASPAVCVRVPEPLPAYEELGPGPRSLEGCSGATVCPTR